MPKKKNFNIFYGVVLAILLFGLFNLGVNVFYESPQYEDYCDNSVVNKLVVSSELSNDYYNTCSTEYQNARDEYNNKVFFIYVIVGLISAVVGLFIINNVFQITAFGAGTAFIIEGILMNLNNKVYAFVAGVIAFIVISYFIYNKIK